MVAKIFYVLFVPIFQTLGLWRCFGEHFWTEIAYFGKLLLVPGAGI